MRSSTTRVHQEMRLFANVVATIRRNGVARLVRVRHSPWRFCPVNTGKARGRIRSKPVNVRRTGVALTSVAKLIFAQQFEAELGEPHVMES